MNELIKLFFIGHLPVTAYALCVALGALLGTLVTVKLLSRRIGLNGSLSLCLAVIPCALLGARLFYTLTNFSYIQIDLSYDMGAFLWQLWEGGYTLYGGILGGMAAVWLYARVTGKQAGELLNLTAPGAALALMVIRLGEYFTGQGLGKMVNMESLQFFPLAVPDLWEDWVMPVFFYEALAAGIVAVIAWQLVRKEGHAAEVFIVLVSLTQILFESWRMDEFIRFGFVRFNQIVSAVLMAAVLAMRIARAEKKRGWQIVRVILFLACMGASVLAGPSSTRRVKG